MTTTTTTTTALLEPGDLIRITEATRPHDPDRRNAHDFLAHVTSVAALDAESAAVIDHRADEGDLYVGYVPTDRALCGFGYTLIRQRCSTYEPLIMKIAASGYTIVERTEIKRQLRAEGVKV